MWSTRFLCQRCSQPLKYKDLPEERPDGAPEQPSEAQDGDGASSTATASAGKLPMEASGRSLSSSDGNPGKEDANFFTLFGKMMSLKSLSSIQDTIVAMDDILSGAKAVEHPVCEECTDCLLAQLDALLALTQSDTEAYARGLRRGLLGREREEEEQRAMHAELRALEREEARLARVLGDMGRHEAAIQAELRAVQAEKEELRRRERQYRADYSALQWQRLELKDELSSLKNQLRGARRRLERLQKTSLFDDAFAIWEDGPLGVINDFRLGRLPGVRVGWGEINAAWGQAALLLLALSRKAALRFQRYQLVPCGSRSYVKALAGAPDVLPLFSDGRHNVFFNNKYDLGMMAFLDCLQQFVEEAGKGPEGLCLPHGICVQEGALEEAGARGQRWFIRTHLNTEEQWTKALKLMLLNLKWILSWASVRYCQD